MAKATVGELIERIGVAVMAAHAVAGDDVYDLHIFLQTYPTQSGPTTTRCIATRAIARAVRTPTRLSWRRFAPSCPAMCLI